MEKKVLTFTIEGPSGSVTAADPKTLIEMMFGSGDYPHVSSPDTLNQMSDEIEECGPVVFKLTAEKRFTQKEIDEMPESDGDIM